MVVIIVEVVELAGRFLKICRPWFLVGRNYHEIDLIIILNILLRKDILGRAYSQTRNF